MTHPSCASAAAPKRIEDGAWDARYDVVVVGMGCAGCVAAITAADEGASVLLVEKAPKEQAGGNSRISGQLVQATDDPDALYAYLAALMGDFSNWDPAVLRAHVDGAAEQYEWLVGAMGVDPNVLVWDEPRSLGRCTPRWTDAFGKPGYVQCWAEYPEYEGAEHCLAFMVGRRGFDGAFYDLCESNVARRSIDVWYEACAEELVMDGGVVRGVQVERGGLRWRVGASGVVLACGGFEANRQMMADFMQQPKAYTFGCPHNTGDGVAMAQRVGASLWHMGTGAAFVWGYLPKGSQVCLWPPASTSKGILVGPSGRRFTNEQAESRHGRVSVGGTYLMRQIPRPTYSVMDAALAARYKFHPRFSEGNVAEIANGTVLTGRTLAELAEAMGVDPDGFQETVARYNDDFCAGRDADYGRPCSTMPGPIAQPPFYALELVPAILNTQGGPRRNARAQVVDPDLKPVKGLFSAGELGALWPDNYNGGGNLGECCTFGRLAGRNAALGRFD